MPIFGSFGAGCRGTACKIFFRFPLNGIAYLFALLTPPSTKNKIKKEK